MNNYPNDYNNQYNQNTPNRPGYPNNQYNPYYQYNQNYQYNPYQYNGANPYQQQQYNEQLRRQMYNSMLRRNEIKQLISDGVIIGATILVYLIVQVIIVSLLQGSKYYSVYESSSTFQNCFNVIAVHLMSMAIPFSVMALILKKRFTGPLIPTQKLPFSGLCAWVALGMGGCMLANIITNGIIKLFDFGGYKLTQPELLKPDNIIALLATLVSTAVIPAIFEEYAMRCCTLGALRKYGKGFAVVAVSIVFGLIHGNLIQFIFAFLVGAVLGYITVRTDNIIPAILIHGFNNGISVLGDFITYFSSSKTADNVETYIVLLWALFAVAALVYLLANHELLPKKEQNAPQKPYKINFGIKLLCLAPGFFVPFTILAFITSQYIQHK